MLVRGIEFGGFCSGGCGAGNDAPGRGGVEVGVSEDGRDPDAMGDASICLRCAERLAARIVRAVAKVRAQQARGREYRHGKWVTRVTMEPRNAKNGAGGSGRAHDPARAV